MTRTEKIFDISPFRICKLLGTAPKGKAQRCISDQNACAYRSAEVVAATMCVSFADTTFNSSGKERIRAARGLRVILNMGNGTWINVRDYTCVFPTVFVLHP